MIILIGGSAMLYLSLRYHTNGTVLVNGEEREYLLHVPKSYDRSKPVPLVISLHAAMSWPEFQMELTRWDELADEQGFLVVYPAGSGFGPRSWEMNGWGNPPNMKEVRFISALIAKLRGDFNIDPARIYADGISNGGGMAFILSCTLSDRIAAFGTVSAAQLLPQNVCKEPRPAPVMSFHGTGDHVVPYEGGHPYIAPLPFPDQREWTAAWARRNHCASQPVEARVASNVKRTQYSGCAGNAAVVLYTIHGGGHQWPGGKPVPFWLVAQMAMMGLPIGPYTDTVDATRLLWSFYREHPLRRD